MRLLTMFLVALLTAASTKAQEPTPLNLPISFDKIRDGLLQAQPAEPLKGLTAAEQPTFRINITEQQKFEELIAKIKFDPPGPQVPGGIYYYDQYQRLFPRIDNPRVQPYGAFTTGEIATLAVEALVEKFVAEKMAHIVGGALRAQAEREAREEVARTMAAYWASQSAASAPAAPLPKE
jgi:hypothetical protein